MLRIPLLILPFAACISPLVAGEWLPLFNGKNLNGWTTVLQNHSAGEDPDRLLQVRDGVIHMYADTDPAVSVPFGVIVHEKPFSRFHLTLEYRWGAKKFAPRKESIRDAGVLYHASNTESVWPHSFEYQIQEGDTGDIVFLPKAGVTWMRPDPAKAPEGQGDPGMLPEAGGFPKDFGGTKFAYIGRLPVYDTLEGWNRVDLIVQADESAEHVVNGKTIARIANLREQDGTPARDGKIALQLEGAEILYRDVKIRELGEPLRAEKSTVTLSAVKGHKARKTTVVVKNPSSTERRATLEVTGKDAACFKVTAEPPVIAAGGATIVTVEFTAQDRPGRFSAGLRIGGQEEGAFVVLQGIGLAAFEGKNEPTLQSIVHALGMPLDVGGEQLELDTKKSVIGQSAAIAAFRAAGPGKVRMTPIARFSPTGATPFGIVLAGETALLEKGRLADVSDTIPDAHQTLFPPLNGGAAAVEFDAPQKPFAFYMKGHLFDSFTDPAIKTAATLPHTGRVFPVHFFQGRKLENAWLVGFEEAANGDYQDAVFLIENVVAAE